eukprot:TRINITY_DN1810_c0_g2_i9.p1 TRINITY_DN1810_c0_g2~~TRINITY_DN1810_c0_g2_i9.p1  ORF type:complete len:389 (+),score=99.88 TRINITY_DN1810_c0_g2_i9:590-1756(+)
MNAYITEPFAVYELRGRVHDLLLDELVPDLEKRPVKVVVDEEPVNRVLATEQARVAWYDYVDTTKHSKSFFVDQQEKIKTFVNDIHKKTSLFQSRVDSLQALGNRNISEVKKFAEMNTESLNAISIFQKKSIEEMILNDEPYSALMRGSHLSVAMKRFSGSSSIGKSASITCKAPITVSYKLGPLPINKTEDLGNKKKELAKEELRKRANKKTFEQWVKKEMTSNRSRRMVDQWYKEVGHKIPDAQSYTSPLLKKQMNSLDSKSDLEEKLKEKSAFNCIFGERINRRMKEMLEKQNDGFKGYAARESAKEAELVEIPDDTLILPQVPIKDPNRVSMKKFDKILSRRLTVEKKTADLEKLDNIIKGLKKVNATARNEARSVLFSPSKNP